MANDIVNLLCHFIGDRMTSFLKCGVKHKTITQNMSILLALTPGTPVQRARRAILSGTQNESFVMAGKVVCNTSRQNRQEQNG